MSRAASGRPSCSWNEKGRAHSQGFGGMVNPIPRPAEKGCRSLSGGERCEPRIVQAGPPRSRLGRSGNLGSSIECFLFPECDFSRRHANFRAPL